MKIIRNRFNNRINANKRRSIRADRQSEISSLQNAKEEFRRILGIVDDAVREYNNAYEVKGTSFIGQTSIEFELILRDLDANEVYLICIKYDLDAEPNWIAYVDYEDDNRTLATSDSIDGLVDACIAEFEIVIDTIDY